MTLQWLRDVWWLLTDRGGPSRPDAGELATLAERDEWMARGRLLNGAPILVAPGGTPLSLDSPPDSPEIRRIPPEWVQGQVGDVPFAHLTVQGDAAARPVQWRPVGYLDLHGVTVTRAFGWSSTAPALFEVLPGRLQPPLPIIQHIQEALSLGLDTLDPRVVTGLGALLPPGQYLVFLRHLRPRPVRLGDPDDYLSNELVTLCGQPPGRHRTEPYYACDAESLVRRGQNGMDFIYLERTVILPTQAASRLDVDRVAHYRDQLRGGALPTAVTLLVSHCQNGMGIPTQSPPLGGLSVDMHHLLDGHHKVQAAAECGATLSMLVFKQLGGMSSDVWGWRDLRGTQQEVARSDAAVRAGGHRES